MRGVRRIAARIPDELYLYLTLLAASTKKSKEELVIEALQEYIEKRKDEIKLP